MTTIQGDQIPAPPLVLTSLGERGNVRHHVRGDSPGACARLGGKDVDLTKVSPGDGLTAQCTEAVAMLVEKS